MSDRMHRPARVTHRPAKMVTRGSVVPRCSVTQQQDEFFCSTCGMRRSVDNSSVADMKSNCPNRQGSKS